MSVTPLICTLFELCLSRNLGLTAAGWTCCQSVYLSGNLSVLLRRQIEKIYFQCAFPLSRQMRPDLEVWNESSSAADPTQMVPPCQPADQYCQYLL